jgi:hypothetical protein
MNAEGQKAFNKVQLNKVDVVIPCGRIYDAGDVTERFVETFKPPEGS